MDTHDAAQALELVRALRHQLHEMTIKLTWLERQAANSSTDRSSAIRSEAAALRRDIDEAQIYVNRLQRRYLNVNGHGHGHGSRPVRRQAR
jgi:hypothetical protein